MDRRTYLNYFHGTSDRKAKNLAPFAKNRFCHTCGNPLERRVLRGERHRISASSSTTESKAEFAARHFCNSLCRAACKASRIATIPARRFF